MTTVEPAIVLLHGDSLEGIGVWCMSLAGFIHVLLCRSPLHGLVYLVACSQYTSAVAHPAQPAAGRFTLGSVSVGPSGGILTQLTEGLLLMSRSCV